MGKRLNKPAAGYWFVPGGRIRKNEKIADAFKRITLTELGIELSLKDAQLMGAYDHIYDDNFSGEKNINTHYVALGYTITIPANQKLSHDNQHAEFKWWTKKELLNNATVHDNTQAYFI